MSTPFVQDLVRRANLRRWMLALVALALLTLVSMGLVPAVWRAPGETQVSRLTETLVLGFAIMIGNLVADEAVERGVPRLPAYVAAVLLGALAGAWLGPQARMGLGLQFGGADHVMPPVFRFTHPVEMVVFGILVGGLATFVRVNRRTALAARRRQHEAEMARARTQRRTLESQLQALQARVEPMFLFGTLERIQRLYRSDVAAAGATLEDLIVFLRAALPHLRESSSTVGQEALLARSWLSILGRDATGGWDVDVEAADDVSGTRMPALVLLPLVQCAIGERDGTVLRLRVAARRVDGRLQIDVRTSTRAFDGGSEGVPPIEQLHQRLLALYGPQASLACGPDATSAGGRCTIELPFEPPPGLPTRGS